MSTEDNHADTLAEALERQDWAALVALTESIRGVAADNAYHHYLRSLALFELGRSAEAREQIDFTLAHFPQFPWTYVVRSRLRLQEGVDEAVFVQEAEAGMALDEGDALTSALTNLAIENGFFAAAKTIGERRRVALDSRSAARFALVIQCFNKPDMLERVLTHAADCDEAGAFDLVVIQDSNQGSLNPEKYRQGTNEVARVLSHWAPALAERFGAVEIVRNRWNMGTAPTCRKVLDRVSRTYEGFVFIEDDCLLSKDGLVWSRAILETHLDREDLWFASCESPCFRTREPVAAEALVERGRKIAQEADVRDATFLAEHVPSSCFITSRAVWVRCAAYRGMPRGPESLSKFLKHNGGRTILPLVPRAADVGRFHDNAYTLQIAGHLDGSNAKNTYLLSERTDVTRIAPFTGDAAALKRLTSTLDASV